MSNSLQQQVGGSHYCNMPIQPVEFITKNNIPFIEGSVIKYVSRHRRKNGRQDIEKAIHFLNLLLDLEYPKIAAGLRNHVGDIANANTILNSQED